MKLGLLAALLAFPFPLYSEDSPGISSPMGDLSRPDSEESDLFRLAGSLFEQQRYPAAAKIYRDFLRHFYGHARAPEAQMMLAECLYRQALGEISGSENQTPSAKIFSEGIKEYSKALEIIPKGDLIAESASFRLAEIQFNLRRYEAALRALERLLADYPGGLLRGEAKLLQAQTFLAAHRPQEAARILRTALKDQPSYAEDPRMAFSYGVALFEVGSASEALTYLNKLQSPAAHLYTARALLTLAKPLLAVEKLKQIPSSDPQGPYVELSRYLVGEAFLQAKDYLSAEQSFEYFLRAYPQSPYRPAAMYKTGLCQYEHQEYLAARGSFQSVLQLAPKNEFAELSLYMTGESFLQEGRLKEAAFAYADMVASFSGRLAGNAQFKLGWTRFKQAEYTGAEAALRQMLAQHPSHTLAPAGALLLGNALTRQDRHAEAVRTYQQALDMLHNSPLEEDQKTDFREACLALLNRANLLGKDYGKLISGYQYVLNHVKPSLSPWRAVTLLYTAEGYFGQGLYDQALGLYREVLRSYPASPESALAVEGIAWCLFKKGNYAQAELEYQKLEGYRNRPAPAPSNTVILNGQLPEGLFLSKEFEIATIRFNQKKYLEALDAYEGFEKNHPEHSLASEAALQAGWCYYRLEYYGQAIKAWERVETNYPNSPAAARAAWSTADTYFRAGQYDKAIATYERILQAYPQDPTLHHARLRIAQSHYNAKEVPKAIAAFEDLMRQAPDSPEASSILDFLSQLLYRPEAKAQAIEALTRIADSRSGSALAAQARFRIAKNLFENADYAGAAQALEKLFAGLAGSEEPADAQFYLAESYYNLKRYKEAALAYERFTMNYPGDARFVAALFHLGACRFQLKDFVGAAEAFRTISRQFPKTSYAPVALYNSALAYRKLGKWEEAALALITYLKNYPEAAKTSNAPIELISLYEEHHQFLKAVEAIQELRENLPKDDAQRLELSFRLGENLTALGEQDKAIAEFQTLARTPFPQDPHRLSALAKLGEHYEAKGQWAEALAAYEDLARSSTRKDWAEAAKAKAQIAREKVLPAAKTPQKEPTPKSVKNEDKPKTTPIKGKKP